MSTLADRHRNGNGSGHGAGADFYAPLLLHLDPDGTVTAEFEGRIIAEGIDLPAHDLFGGDPLLPHSVIQWLRESSGALVARVYGDEPAANESRLLLSAVAQPDVAPTIILWNAPGDSRILAYADSAAPKSLIQEDGGSDFAQIEGGPAIWRMEVVEATLNIASTAAHGAGSNTVTIPGLAVGDYCFFVGVTGFAAIAGLPPFHFWTEAVCTVDEQITLRRFNADTAANDPGEGDFVFLVIHRS